MDHQTFLPCVSVQTMRASDQWTIEHGTSGRTLMYRAAMGVFLAGVWNGRIMIAAGPGNNGGDGYALACILAGHGYACRVVTSGGKRSGDGAFFAARAERLGVPMEPYAPGAFAGASVIVDCLLGTGFHGTLREPYADMIAEINAANAYVLSVDINSGMNGDTGEAEAAARSDLTVTIGFVKTGLVAPAASRCISRLLCADIGITCLKEDARIVPHMMQGEGQILCPPYLDMELIDVSGLTAPGD